MRGTVFPLNETGACVEKDIIANSWGYLFCRYHSMLGVAHMSVNLLWHVWAGTSIGTAG